MRYIPHRSIAGNSNSLNRHCGHGGDQWIIHHGDRGNQYLSIRYTERLAQANIDASVGSIGDSYDNAMAETMIILQ